MKRLGSSDSLSGLMSICQNSTDEHNHGSSHVYSREFQSMLEGLDEEGCVEESGHIPEKKRRLSVDQVKALEKNFEVENKLEPDRKVKLAQELGLQPRQVAVWFQNRRARWKTKQLERDYGVLKANFDALKHNYEKLQLENDVLIQEIDELKSKLQDDKGESNVSVKEEAEALASESEDIAMDTEKEKEKEKEKAQMDDHVITEYDDEEEEATELNFESFNSNNGLNLMGVSLFTDIKDGSSDSDSSAILNEDNNINNNNHSPNAASSVGKMLQMAPLEFFNNTSNGSSSQLLSMGGFQFSDSKATAYQPQFVKIEEHNFFSGDESCSTFFSDDQPPSLHWDCPEEWN